MKSSASEPGLSHIFFVCKYIFKIFHSLHSAADTFNNLRKTFSRKLPTQTEFFFPTQSIQEIGAIILQNCESFEPESHFISRWSMIFQVRVVLNRTVAMLLVVSPTSRFANVPFANVLCRFAKKRNERCACICFVCSAMIQKSATDQAKAVTEMTQHVRETTSEVSEQGVGETTSRRNDRKPRDIIGRLSVKP